MLASRTRFAFFALACALAASSYVVATAPRNVFPEIRLARVEVFASAGDLGSEAIRTAVAEPLQATLGKLPDVRAMRAYESPGTVEIELDFDPATSPDEDLRIVRSALAQMRVPEPVTSIASAIEGPDAEPVVTYAIVAHSVSQAELARRVRAAILPTFTGTPELGRLAVFAGPRETYDVDLDARRLAAHGIDARDVARALADANATRTAGSLVRGAERLDVVANASLSDARSIANVRVFDRGAGALAVRDLGDVRAGEQSTGRQASFDGEHAVLVSAYPTADGDAVALARGIATRLAALEAGLPADARVTLAWDQTRLIDASQRALAFEMLLGAGIALIVIGLFLRNVALTAVAAIVLPVALALTLAALVRLGLRLDIMTLGGLAIAVGLIVDEAIVVVEAIARGGTIASAVRRIAKPLIASTAANIVVFLPLAFLGGVPGFFFRALAMTLAIALVTSVALSLLVAPSLAAALGHRVRAHATALPSERPYARAIAWSLAHRPWVLVVAGAAVALAVVLLARTPTDFLPEIDEGQFEVSYALPPGMSAQAADAVATTLEQTVLVDPNVAHVARLSGIDTNDRLPVPPDAGTLRLTLRPGHPDRFDTIAEHMRAALRSVQPYAAFEIHQLLEDQINDLSGAPEPIQFTVRGPSQATLTTIAGKLADSIDDVRGIVDVFDGVTYQARTIGVHPRTGEGGAAFADDVRARLDGLVATEIASGADGTSVVVHVKSPEPLDRFARFDTPEFATTVEEDDGARVVRVTAGLEGADLSTATARIDRNIAPVLRALPVGYHVEEGGAVAAQRAAFAQFATVLAIALALVFGVLLAAFDSYRCALAVLAAVPLAPIGVAIALAVTNTPLDVASFMGILLLVGIVVRNGILLVDAAERRVREGASATDAMQRAALERLRPIAMTTLATLGALAPLAFGLGAGAEMERPLAVAVIGGIVAATGLTVLVVPALYVAAAGARRRPPGVAAANT